MRKLRHDLKAGTDLGYGFFDTKPENVATLVLETTQLTRKSRGISVHQTKPQTTPIAGVFCVPAKVGSLKAKRASQGAKGFSKALPDENPDMVIDTEGNIYAHPQSKLFLNLAFTIAQLTEKEELTESEQEPDEPEPDQSVTPNTNGRRSKRGKTKQNHSVMRTPYAFTDESAAGNTHCVVLQNLTKNQVTHIAKATGMGRREQNRGNPPRLTTGIPQLLCPSDTSPSNIQHTHRHHLPEWSLLPKGEESQIFSLSCIDLCVEQIPRHECEHTTTLSSF